MEISRLIRAPRSKLYGSLLDPQALASWLPPRGMRAEVHWFDAREGGGYRMTLAYEGDAGAPRGKTTDDTDFVAVRFTELVPDERLVQEVDFESDDPAYAGTMTTTWRLADAPGGTLVSVAVANAPPAIREEDHATGIRSTLGNLAAFTE